MLAGREEMFEAGDANVVITNGVISCVGECVGEVTAAIHAGTRTVSLHNGYIVPPATAFGSSLGLVEIEAEESTRDGDTDDNTISRAVDGLALDTKSLRGGVFARGDSSYLASDFLLRRIQRHECQGSGLELSNRWRKELYGKRRWRCITPSPKPTRHRRYLWPWANYRRNFMDAVKSNATDVSGEARWLREVVEGCLPLVIYVHSADHIASLLRLKNLGRGCNS